MTDADLYRIRCVLDQSMAPEPGTFAAAAKALLAHADELQAEVDSLRERLADRKVIERAKGVLMRERRCSEHEAYRLLRKVAMDTGRTIAGVARGVIEGRELREVGP